VSLDCLHADDDSACARRWLSCAPQGGGRLQSSFWSKISSLQARVRYGSRPCSRESRLIRERDSCFCHCGLVCHLSSWYIHLNVTQSIVCEWHQFQGLNVVIYSQYRQHFRACGGLRGNLITPSRTRPPVGPRQVVPTHGLYPTDTMRDALRAT